MIRILHIINIECDRKTKKIDVSNYTEEEIKNKIKEYYIKGINFPKIIEYYK